MPSPNPNSSDDLSGVAATSAGNAWAVGSLRVPTGQLPLALHWDGSAWTAAPTPILSTTLTELAAVGGSSASNIWAVGDHTDNPTSTQRALAIHCC